MGYHYKRLEQLENGKFYTIQMGTDYHAINIIEIKVVLKLPNSVKLLLIEENVEKWYDSNTDILFFDEVPISYYRKQKLQKIKEKDEDE